MVGRTLVVALWLCGMVEARGIVTTATAAHTFFGNKPAKVVYTFSGAVYFIDFSEAALTERKIFTGTVVDQSLQISPDGTRICYSIGSTAYVRTVMANSPSTDLRNIGNGLFPHWWVHPGTGDEYLILQRSDGMYCQKLDASSKASGTANKLIGNKLANAGRSRDGKYLVSDEDAFMWQISPVTAVSAAKIDQQIEFWGTGNDTANCNASMIPATSTSSQYYGCILHLGRYHTQVYIRKFSTTGTTSGSIIKVSGSRIAELSSSTIIKEGEWVHPEWSTHEKYFTAGGIPLDSDTKATSDGYVVDATKRTSLRFMESGLQFTHLWVQGEGQTGPTARLTANPTQGAAPLTVKFNGTTSSGSNLTYEWSFGDGSATATGDTVSHTYKAAGTFTAKLTVKSGTSSSSATTTITAGNTASVLTTIDLTPQGPVSVTKGSSTTFDAVAKDQFDQVMNNPGTITWKVENAVGGTITSAGVYTAGSQVGKSETVSATIGSVKGTCVVNILDLPIVLTSVFTGKSYKVGDTLRIRWTADAARASAIVISASFDGGKSYVQISDGNSIVPTDSMWQDYPWVIPAEVVNASGTAISTTSSQVKIQVGAYDSPAGITPAISGAFAITAAMNATLGTLRAQSGQLLQLKGSELNVRFDPTKGSSTLRLIDLSGKVARTISMNRSGTIPLHGLTAGMYRAELVQGGAAVVSELLKFGF